MIVMGIVGPPAGGKSTVARRLAEHGATWIDADQVAREAIELPEVKTKLIDRFGPSITDADGQIDRRRLASLVFGDDDSHRAALTYLEGAVHPPTRREVHARLQRAAGQGGTIAVLEVVLLFEAGWDVCCDTIWCVDSSREVRQRRAAARGWDEAELGRREARQLSSDEKRRRSNHTLINDGELSALYTQVDSLYQVLADSKGAAADSGHCRTDQTTPGCHSLPHPQ